MQTINQQQLTMPTNQQVPMPTYQQQIKAHRARAVNVPMVKGLGIGQVTLGAVILALSVLVMLFDGLDNLNGFPIGSVISGIWFLVSGIIGINASRRPESGCYNGTYLGFNVVSCFFASSFAFIFFIVVVNMEYCYHGCGASRVIGGILIFLLIGEFCVALTSAVFCCIYQCCSKPTQGYIIYPPSSQHQIPSYGSIGSNYQPSLYQHPSGAYVVAPQLHAGVTPILPSGVAPQLPNYQETLQQQPPPIYQDKVWIETKNLYKYNNI